MFFYLGIPKMKIPGLEPLVIPALEINRNNDALQVKAKLKDIQAFGGTGFVINRLKWEEPISLSSNIIGHNFRM